MCVCVWMFAARDRETPKPPQGVSVSRHLPGGPHLSFLPLFLSFPVFFLSLYSPPSGSYVPGYGLSFGRFLSPTFLFEELESWNFQGTLENNHNENVKAEFWMPQLGGPPPPKTPPKSRFFGVYSKTVPPILIKLIYILHLYMIHLWCKFHKKQTLFRGVAPPPKVGSLRGYLC